MINRIEGLEFSVVGICENGVYRTFIKLWGSCHCCGKRQIVEMKPEQFQQWIHAEKVIQDIFPDMDSDDREFLISRNCGECFESMFAEGE
jgi:hypothetical protein